MARPWRKQPQSHATPAIEAMAVAIQRGEWQLTGEAIKLDDEGRVRDGNSQHLSVMPRNRVGKAVNDPNFVGFKRKANKKVGEGLPVSARSQP